LTQKSNGVRVMVMCTLCVTHQSNTGFGRRSLATRASFPAAWQFDSAERFNPARLRTRRLRRRATASFSSYRIPFTPSSLIGYRRTGRAWRSSSARAACCGSWPRAAHFAAARSDPHRSGSVHLLGALGWPAQRWTHCNGTAAGVRRARRPARNLRGFVSVFAQCSSATTNARMRGTHSRLDENVMLQSTFSRLKISFMNWARNAPELP
jgi:hypothetical protein